jgi:hypothetical protein
VISDASVVRHEMKLIPGVVAAKIEVWHQETASLVAATILYTHDTLSCLVITYHYPACL